MRDVKKTDDQGRTRAERIIEESDRTRRNTLAAAVIVTSAVMFPLGLLVGWWTGA